MVTPTPAEYENVTNGFASMTDLGPPIGMLLLVLVVIIGMTSSVRFYRWVLDASNTFAKSFEYAIKGVATAAVVAVIGAPFYVLATIEASTRTLVFQALGWLIIAYVGLVVLGYIGEQVWIHIANQHEAATGQRPFQSEEAD